MTLYLRQSTASQEVALPRFVSSVDGNTEMTALTIANTDIKLWKAGATSLVSKNSGGATHMANGVYVATFDATDTDTLGSGKAYIHVSGALSVEVTFCVLAANVYDSLIAGSDLLQVSIAAIVTAAANKLADIITRRHSSDIEASADGDTLNIKSLYGLMARVTHKNARTAATTVTTYKADDTTSLATATIATDAAQEPVSSIDPN